MDLNHWEYSKRTTIHPLKPRLRSLGMLSSVKIPEISTPIFRAAVDSLLHSNLGTDPDFIIIGDDFMHIGLELWSLHFNIPSNQTRTQFYTAWQSWTQISSEPSSGLATWSPTRQVQRARFCSLSDLGNENLKRLSAEFPSFGVRSLSWNTFSFSWILLISSPLEISRFSLCWRRSTLWTWQQY